MKRTGWIILAIVVAILIGLFWFFNRNVEKQFNWTTHYKWKSDQPYGLSLLNDLIHSEYEDNTVVLTSNVGEYADSMGLDSYNYVFVSNYYYPDSTEVADLFRSIRKGGQAFISAEYFSEQFQDSAFATFDMFNYCWNIDKTYEGYPELFVKLNLKKQSLNRPIQVNFRRYDDNLEVNWPVFNTEVLDCQLKYGFDVEGWLDSSVNFVRIQIGDGDLFLHTTPLVFSNYHLRKSRVFTYANRALPFELNAPVLIETKNNLGNTALRPPTRSTTQNPIRYLFSVPSLKYAWMVILGGIVFYMLFSLKRIQRRIAIIPPVKNFSLSFSKAISQLYFKNQDDWQMATYKMNHFKQFVRQRYNVRPGEDLNQYYNLVGLYSGVDSGLMKKIQNYEQLLAKSKSFSTSALMYLVNDINRFYSSCK